MLRGWIERRRAIRRDAEAMMRGIPAMEAWHAARALGSNMERPESARAHWWRVAGLIEIRAGIRRNGAEFVPPL